MLASVVHQMLVIHTGRAGGHAGQTGQAAIDMGDDLGCGRRICLEHLLHEIDTAARTVELVAQGHIGRTGRGAEPAMDTGPQNVIGFRDIRIGKLGQREMGLHRLDPFVHATGVENASRIETVLHPG